MKMNVTLPALLLLAVAAAVPAAAEELFKPNEQSSLAKQLADYRAARRANKGVDKALEAVRKELDKIEKRLKRDPLALQEDLGRALWQSNAYDRGSKVQRGRVTTVKFPAYYDDKAELAYAIWAPSKYDPRRSYPLILCLPDQEERVSDHLVEKWVDAAVREGAILVAVPMPTDRARWLETGEPGKEGGGGNMLVVLGQIMENVAIDFDRVYLAGRGLGVAAALTFAARYPDRFAGVIGRSGDAVEVQAENLRNLPSFFAGAGANASALAERLDQLGYKNCTLKADGSEADIWAWMQAHPRQSNPAEVVLHPGSPIPNKAYWVEVPVTDWQGTPWLKASADRALNTITVEGEVISQVTLYFNDAIVDLDKPIKLLLNGTETTVTVPRNLPRLLDFIYASRSDPGKLYVANRQFDLPSKPKPK